MLDLPFDSVILLLDISILVNTPSYLMSLCVMRLISEPVLGKAMMSWLMYPYSNHSGFEIKMKFVLASAISSLPSYSSGRHVFFPLRMLGCQNNNSQYQKIT